MPQRTPTRQPLSLVRACIVYGPAPNFLGSPSPENGRRDVARDDGDDIVPTDVPRVGAQNLGAALIGERPDPQTRPSPGAAAPGPSGDRALSHPGSIGLLVARPGHRHRRAHRRHRANPRPRRAPEASAQARRGGPESAGRHPARAWRWASAKSHWRRQRQVRSARAVSRALEPRQRSRSQTPSR